VFWSLFSAIEVSYENALHKFPFDIDFDFTIIRVNVTESRTAHNTHRRRDSTRQLRRRRR